jgi:hypothetical protein
VRYFELDSISDVLIVSFLFENSVPFESTIKSIHPLSKRLRDVRINNAINCGCIINCVPATNVFLIYFLLAFEFWHEFFKLNFDVFL